MTETTPTNATPSMLRSVSQFPGYRLLATDGEIGEVVDTYFDDQDWCLRYFVLDTGKWLSRRSVLISPASCGHPDWSQKLIPVDVSRHRVRSSPPADLAQPVSRQYEVELHEFYGWPLPWTAGLGARHPGPLGDTHLRSTREVTGYAIQASNGKIGHVEDFIVEENTWIIRYIVVDTRNWLPGRKVLVAPAWVSDVHWPDRRVTVDLTREKIRNSPKYQPTAPINREYESQLYDYYGRPVYW
jgi:hypothetical protein